MLRVSFAATAVLGEVFLYCEKFVLIVTGRYTSSSKECASDSRERNQA